MRGENTWMGRKKEKGQVILSFLVCIITLIILRVLILSVPIDKDIIVVLNSGIILWPIIEILNYKYNLHSLEGKKRKLLELKLSIISCIVMLMGIIFISIFIRNEIEFSIYRISVIMLWPIYNFFIYIIEEHSLRK